MTAWIGGRPADFAEAVATAANLLRDARLPLVTGHFGDVATVKAALDLSIVCRGVADHLDSGSAYAAISAFRDGGAFLGVPAEIRRRADLVVVFGPDAFASAPDLLSFLVSGPPDLGAAAGRGRRILWIGAPASLPNTGAVPVETVPCAPEHLGEAAGTIRAALAGRRFSGGPLAEGAPAQLAQTMGSASFGCLAFACPSLSSLDIEMLEGLASDLNAATRFTTLPVFETTAAWGAALLALSRTGFPLRTSFGPGHADHDPMLFEGTRLIRTGEADLALVVATDDDRGPPVSPVGIPLIALARGTANWAAAAQVRFEHGEAEGGAVYDPLLASFRPRGAAPAQAAGAMPAAAILAAIASRLSAEEGA